MRCLLLLLLMAILSLLAALFVRRKSGREVATENNFRIQLMDSAITKKPPKRKRKKEKQCHIRSIMKCTKDMSFSSGRLKINIDELPNTNKIYGCA